jgi:3-mercaptopyruvate sulfurtransferase SseA
MNTAGIPGVRALLGGFAKWQADGNAVAHGDSPR